MPYITLSDFTAYTSTAIPADEFDRLAERASDIVDTLTIYKITNGRFEALPQYAQGQVKKAVCAQVDTMYAQGGNEALTGSAGGMASVSVGKFSYSNENGSDGFQTIDGVPLSPLLTGYLLPTGLLYRGVAVCG